MSAITIGNNLVHYEHLGRGKPVILLHSWLGSWRYWIPTMQQLSVSKYRTYALDLWGFGDTGRNIDAYSLEGQMKLVDAFLDKMAIPKAVFVGHGLGAAVVTHYAQSPQGREKVHRLITVTPPLFDTSPPARSKPRLLTEANQKPPEENKPSAPSIKPDSPTIPRAANAGIDREELLRRAIEAGLSAADPTNEFKKPSIPKPLNDEEMKPPERVPYTPEANQAGEQKVLSKHPLCDLLNNSTPQQLLSRHIDTSSSNYEKLKTEVEKTDQKAVVGPCREVHTYRQLLDLKVASLVLVCQNDTFMKPPEEEMQERLRQREDLAFVEFDQVRHFPMLEDTTKFTRLLREFMETSDVAKLKMKDEWRRRTR